MVSAAPKRARSLLYPALHPWGNMASTPSKSSAGGKAGARSVSSSRLVAQKTAKAQKLATAREAPGPRTSTPPAAIGKSNSRWPKSRTSAPPSPHPDDRSLRAARRGSRTRPEVAPARASSRPSSPSCRPPPARSRPQAIARTRRFYDIGALLNQIRNERLYEVKGYGSFESFVERELDMNKVLCMRSRGSRKPSIGDQALAAGLERAAAAVAALDGESRTPSRRLVRQAARPVVFRSTSSNLVASAAQ